MAFKNFAYSTVVTAPSPADSGTSVTVVDAAVFPAPPFQATVWAAGVQPLVTNAEVVTVTAVASNTLTITRAQEDTDARSIVAGDQFAATITAGVLDGLGGGGGAAVPFVGAAPPGSPADGDLWWDTDDETEAAGGGSQTVLRQAFSLTAQQIKDSTLTPHTIVPAQGAGTMVIPTKYAFNFQAGATPFNDGNLELVYGDLNLNALANAIFNGPDNVFWTSQAIAEGFKEGGDPADYLNQPIRLRAHLRGSILANSIGPSIGNSGYAVGDTGTVDYGSPEATYIVTAVGGIGSDPVAAFTITDGGDGYNLGAGGAPSEWTTTPGGAQPGAGSGLTINVESVDASASAGDGTLTGAVYYLIEDFS